jgi:hypothetical protein
VARDGQERGQGPTWTFTTRRGHAPSTPCSPLSPPNRLPVARTSR